MAFQYNQGVYISGNGSRNIDICQDYKFLVTPDSLLVRNNNDAQKIVDHLNKYEDKFEKLSISCIKEVAEAAAKSLYSGRNIDESKTEEIIANYAAHRALEILGN